MRRLFFAVMLVYALSHASVGLAHEVRPAYLEIDQTAPDSYTVTWKQPTLGELAVHLVPHLSNGWLEQPPADRYAAGDFMIRTWTIRAQQARPLDGCRVTIEGLENTYTDAFVRIRLLNGPHLDTILRPEAPSFQMALGEGAPMTMSVFVLLGIEHILTGPDHLLFVLGLLLMVRDRWMLLKTVSAFTLAHSLTLAMATLGAFSLPLPLLNALIALSILFVAQEVIRFQRGRTSLTLRYPWVVAFLFGLLHGMGFASGLSSLGLERSALLGALVLFNVGVEIGQLAFIVGVLALRRAFRLMEIRWPRVAVMAPTYAIGVSGATWTLQYSAILFGLSQ